jgi:hypothetical protein
LGEADKSTKAEDKIKKADFCSSAGTIDDKDYSRLLYEKM